MLRTSLATNRGHESPIIPEQGLVCEGAGGGHLLFVYVRPFFLVRLLGEWLMVMLW